MTVTGVDDDIAGGDRSATISHAVAGGGYGNVDAAAVDVTVMDDDGAGVTVRPQAVSVSESGDGNTATYEVVLTSRPTGDVTVTPTSSAVSAAVVSGALTFTDQDWDEPQTVTVTGVDDDIAGGDRSATISHAVAGGGYDNVAAADVTVTVIDDEIAGVTVTPVAGLETTEAGGTAIFTVVLDSAPTSDVTIGLSSSDASEGTVSPAVLTFTAANWNQARTVTVTGADDEVVDGDQDYTIETAGAVSTDASYSGRDPADVSVTNIDDDVIGITVSRQAVSVDENGGMAIYTVVLDSLPTGDVTVTPTSSAPANATVSGALTFTEANWNEPQTVTVTGVDDDIDNPGDERTATISHAISGGGYAVVEAAAVAVIVIDDDSAGVSVDPVAGLKTTEAGGGATFAVMLESEPTSDVTIGLSSSDTSEGTVSPVSLTFTSANWSNAQTVTVTGVDDPVTDGDVDYTIETAPVVSADTAYNGLNPDDVSATNEDDDISGTVIFVVESEDAGTVGFRSETEVLNVAVLVLGGTSRSDEISVPVGEHRVDYLLPTGFSVTNASCLPDTNAVDRREKRISLSVKPGATITCTLSVEDAATRTAEEIADFMEERAWLIMSNRSDKHRRIARLKDERLGASLKIQGHNVPGQFASPLSLAMDATEGAEKLQFRFSCTQGASGGGQGQGAAGNACGSNDWWMEGFFGRYTRGEAKGTYAITHAGFDRRLGEDVLVGLAVQYDRVVREGKGDRPGATFRSDGWMAGPYITWRLHDRLYLDAGISAGTATNRIAMTDGGASGTFNSQRFSGYATLLGDFDHGNWNIRPQLGFSWYEETAPSWTGTDVDGHGISIPEVQVRTGDLEAGVRFTHSMEDNVSSQYFEIEGVLALAGNTDKENRLRVGAGLTAAMPFGGVVDAGISFDGLGDEDWQAYGLKLGYSVAPYWLPGTVDAGLSFNGSGVEAFDFQGLTLDFRSVPDPWLGGLLTTSFSFEAAEETESGSGGDSTMSVRLGYKAKF